MLRFLHRSAATTRAYHATTNQQIGAVTSTIERAVNTIFANKQCQMTTSDPRQSLPYSSNVPFLSLSKNTDMNMLFVELMSDGKDEEELESRGQDLMNMDFVFLTNKQSKHNESLLYHQQQEKEETYDEGPKAVKMQIAKDFEQHFKSAMKESKSAASFSIGLSDLDLVSRFQLAGKRYPPRTVFAAQVDPIPSTSRAFTKLWKDHFKVHPHVAFSMKPEDVNMFRARGVTAAFYVDISGEMASLDSLQYVCNLCANLICSEFTTITHDSLAPNMRNTLARLNKDEDLLERLCRRGFNLQLAEKFAFYVDRKGIRVLGREGTYVPKRMRKTLPGTEQLPVPPEAWSEYYLDLGEEIHDDRRLFNLLAAIK